ncbi:restriction endonuclease subunit S [Anabaena sp. CS-542/02]|uniref:restriction endonuclease subunit S n=1 Tax=Anabaena sp. CS-542/02 TaxID=3021719 RepID=UPI00232C251B|nr:restriction endonuclease subunit S [Anabaena sp. CS-542/02]MDB9447385.1 restriction endonuclease subunit S [Anabaena sp. CS-542/02]
MKVDTFFTNFDLLTDAPNATAKLRELILQLAVMGKLVRQEPNDEPASFLLEKIKLEKEWLIKEKKIRKSQILPAVEIDEVAFKLPVGWEWTRLDDICSKITDGVHKTPKYTECGIPFLSVTQLKNGMLDFSNTKYISPEEHEIYYQRCNPEKGDILICKVGSTIGVTTVVEVDIEFSIFVQLALIKQIIVNPYYLKFVLLSDEVQNYIKENSVGSAMPYISLEKLKYIQVPLPPLAEQKRIVEKCDRLMSLCDEIEKQHKQKQDSIVRMNEGAIAQLLSSQNPDDFRHHWERICNNFDLLYSVPETIPKLRQAILQLAVMGKLVRQDPNDEPAAVLLERIKKQKEELVKDNKIKKINNYLPVKVSDITFSLPSSWKFIRLGECIELVSGQHLGADEQNNNGMGISYLTGASDFGQVYPTITRWTKQPKAVAIENDILLSVKGTVGKSNILNLKQAGIGRQLMALRPILVNYQYLYIFCLSASDKFYSLSTGIAIPGISRDHVLQFIFPLPPLAEQKRIVEKCDRLMSLCDRLEAKLKQGRESTQKLMEVAAKQVLLN